MRARARTVTEVTTAGRRWRPLLRTPGSAQLAEPSTTPHRPQHHRLGVSLADRPDPFHRRCTAASQHRPVASSSGRVVSPETFWTPSGVRLRRRTQRPGPLNWLFLPGGPGIGSESLHELVDSAELPGSTWLVDLPGDGSNTDAPGARPTPTRSGHRSCSKPSRCS